MIVWYLFLAGVGAGAYIVAVLMDYLGLKSKLASKIGVALAAPLVIVGTLLLLLDLGQPDKFMLVFNNPVSMITVGSMILSVFMIIGVVHIGLWIWPFKYLEKATSARRMLSILGLIFAFGTAIYTGVLLGVVRAVPFWNNSMVPMLFLISAVSTGVAAVVLGLSMYYGRRVGEEQRGILESVKSLVKADAVLIGAELVAVFFYLAIASTAGESAYASVQLLTTGALAPLFWGGLIGLGLVVPLVLDAVGVFTEKTLTPARLTAISMLTSVLLLAGGLILRESVVAAGVPVAVWFMAPPFVYELSLLDYSVILLFPIALLAIYGVAKAYPAGRKAKP